MRKASYKQIKKLKLHKRYINDVIVVGWADANSRDRDDLFNVLRTPFALNKSIGWLKYFDREKLILSQETSSFNANEDFIVIPTGWIEKVEFVKHSKRK